MSLQLHFSNHFEALVRELSSALDGEWTDFASPPPVVVPSPAVAKWLKLRLCEMRGALIGLPTPTLEGFLWKALAPDPGMKILRVDALQQALIPLLNKERLSRAEYASVRQYLCPQTEIDPKRRCQLAHEIGRMFLEYEYNRPSVWKNDGWGVKGLDQSWPTRSYFTKAGDPELDAEIWQRDLHGAVFAKDGPLAESGRLGLPRLHRIRREAGWKPSGGPVMVFGVEKVSHFHRNLLLELSEGRTVHLFLVNPCAEFWEDVDTSRRRKARHSVRLPRFNGDDYQAADLSESLYPAGAKERMQDPFLLQRWGRTPRESLSLWSQVVDYNFDFEVEAPLSENVAPTILNVLQQSLVQRHPGPVVQDLELDDGRVLSGAVPRDKSLLLHDCPERGREMEAIRDQILEWLSEEESRSVSDIVVLMPDPSRHRMHIHRVFAGLDYKDAGHLPWVILGESAGESQWARAVGCLMELAKGECDRPHVFALLRNPLVQNRLGVDAEIVARWESWAELSGMIRAWDAAHRLELGDSAEASLDTHTFRAGVLRLLMAPLAARDFAVGLSVTDGLLERIPVASDFDSDSTEVEVFAACLERLFHDIREFPRCCQNLTPSDLVAKFASWLDAWIGLGDDAEARVRRELLESLELVSIQEKAGRDRLSFLELEELVKSYLTGDLPASARAFAGAITFAPLKSGHVLPHGLVILAGFDAKAFPGDGMRTKLDLLATTPLVGDADVVRDNRALFLEAVLSARSRLVVTWLGRDIQKDEQLEPSSVVLELEEALKNVADRSCRTKVRFLAREAVMPGETNDDPFSVPSWDPRDLVEPTEPTKDPWATGQETCADVVRLTISDVRSFLKDSFLHHLRKTLEWEDDPSPQTLDAAHEPLSVSPLDDSIWKSELLGKIADQDWNALANSEAIDAMVTRFVGAKAWGAKFPEAGLAASELESLRIWARSIARQLARLRDEFPNHRLVCGLDLSLGLHGKTAQLELVVDSRKVLVSHRIPCALVPIGSTGSVVLLEVAKVKGLKTKPSVVEKSRSYGAQLVAIAIAASGWTRGVEIRFFAKEPEIAPAKEHGLVAPLGWLEAVVGDLLRRESQYLPAKAILDQGFGKLNLAMLREKLTDSDFSDYLEDLFEPFLPGESDGDDRRLEDLATRRLGPFLGGSDA